LRSAGPLRFTIYGGTILVASGLALLPWAVSRGPTALRWGALGWSITALIGLAGGAWMARTHGKPGAGFLVALGTCMLARLFASVAGALVAATRGLDAIWPYVAGLGAGYVPLQLFELGWFLRRSKSRFRGPSVAGKGPAGEVGLRQ
jgi:hypothetical protein